MHIRLLMAGLIAIFTLGWIHPGRAGPVDDPYIAVATNVPGVSNYILRMDIEVVLDSNPSKCALILTNARYIRAYESCAGILAELKRADFVIFTNNFGKVLVTPTIVTHLTGTNNGGCRVSLQNGRYVFVNETCAAVRKSLTPD